MALAFRIKDPDDFGMLFSAYDEYTSILNSLFGRVLTPNDDYYTSPGASLRMAILVDTWYLQAKCHGCIIIRPKGVSLKRYHMRMNTTHLSKEYHVNIGRITLSRHVK